MTEIKGGRAARKSSERGRDRAMRRMNPALRAEYLKLGDAIARNDWSEAHAKYEIGEIAARVSDAATYGEGAVKLLAKALGYEKDVLYDAARVASCWSKSAFDDVLARPTPYRRPISFRHFVVLSHVADAKKREALLEEALRAGLSSRALEKLVSARRPKRADPQGTRFARTFILQQRAARKWVHALDDRALDASGTRELLASACEEARRFIADVEAKLASEGTEGEPRKAKSPNGDAEELVFGPIRKSVGGLFGMPLTRRDGEA